MTAVSTIGNQNIGFSAAFVRTRIRAIWNTTSSRKFDSGQMSYQVNGILNKIGGMCKYEVQLQTP